MNKEFYKKLVDKFGKAQLGKCVEELVELQQVLIWELNAKGKNKKYIREKVIEEVADILMTFESLKLIYNITDKEIQNQIIYKEMIKEKQIFGKNEDDYIKCDKCGKLTKAVFRVNEKGKAGIFWCIECCDKAGISIDKVVNSISKLISGEDELIKDPLIKDPLIKDPCIPNHIIDKIEKMNREEGNNG